MKHITRKIAVAAVVAFAGAMLTQAWHLGSMPAELGAGAMAPVQRSTALDRLQLHVPHTRSPRSPQRASGARIPEDPAAQLFKSASRQCLAELYGDLHQRIDDCLQAAAMADDDKARGTLLRRAAALARKASAYELADQFQLQAAAMGDAKALFEYAAIEDEVPQMQLVRGEALMLAANAGIDLAEAALKDRRAIFAGQAIAEPVRLVALLEGRGLELRDTEDLRRYYVGLLAGLDTACRWQAELWGSAGFRRVAEQYQAPLQATAHVRVVDDLGVAVTGFGRAAVDFARSMGDGQDYAAAAAEFARQFRTAQRGLNTVASAASERGTRDATRLPAIVGGCDSADIVRLTRGLMAVFADRPGSAPIGLATTQRPAPSASSPAAGFALARNH